MGDADEEKAADRTQAPEYLPTGVRCDPVQEAERGHEEESKALRRASPAYGLDGIVQEEVIVPELRSLPIVLAELAFVKPGLVLTHKDALTAAFRHGDEAHLF
jgi:hypothetical protein